MFVVYNYDRPGATMGPKKAKAKSTSGRLRKTPKRGETKQTISQDVYQALKKDILTCRHKPGAVLKEKELAALYGSSRVPSGRPGGGQRRQ